MSSVASAETSEPITRAGKVLVWFGGGHWRDLADHDERATYQLAGFLVLLNGLMAWGVATAAVISVSAVSPLLAAVFTLPLGLLVGAFGRVLASRLTRTRRFGPGDVAGGLVAVLIGLVVGELAALALFAGPIDRALNDKVDQARADVATSELAQRLERLQQDRQQLDADVNAAIAQRNSARAVARCEVDPGPGCPTDQITGDPGYAEEARDAESALAAAERDLARARAERSQDAPGLDRDIAALREQLAADRERAVALARADSGIDARWQAMHTYTTSNPVALVLRLGVLAFFVALNLVPLLLRLWRGQTEQDRRILARRERLRAEEEADTALAIARAEARTEAVAAHAALPPAERAVALAALAERPEMQRPMLTATASRQGEWATPMALESGSPDASGVTASGTPGGTAETAGPTGTALEPRSSGSGEVAHRAPGPLDNLPGPLPGIARAVTGFIPERITQFPAQVVTNPVKTARTLLEDVEELTVTFTRKRSVTVHEEESGGSGADSATAGSDRPRVQHVTASRVIDATDDPAREELSGRSDTALGSGLSTRAVEQGQRRELPSGE
ncbi:DUF4407 domain-containing protein [Haloechinothrix halophila]|uniref:DUF4407 domain-containing protein n=1 Tax=Haloechinothrix halophila TaxID=1069073 RepID=UPI00040FF959|nr:DUF4407 domain-containing protein [Haloechinothrix halophila]